MKVQFLLGCALFVAGRLFSASEYEATPWTKNFLESRIAFSADYRTMHGQSRALGEIRMSSALLQEWEFDVGVSANSVSHQAVFLRGERQLYSDLESSPVAVTVVAQGRLATQKRVFQPIYFEMAKKCAEVGIGIGRHLCIRKTFFTQLFGYVYAGVGSAAKRWGSAEVGLSHVWLSRHFFRCSYTRTQTYGNQPSRFQGVGATHTGFSSISVRYAYRFGSGIEGSLSVVRRTVDTKWLKNSLSLMAGISVPLSL